MISGKWEQKWRNKTSGSYGERQNSCFESEEEVGGRQAKPRHQPVISPFWTQCGTTPLFETTVPMGLVLPEVWLALSDTFPTRVCFLREMFLITIIYLTLYSESILFEFSSIHFIIPGDMNLPIPRPGHSRDGDFSVTELEGKIQSRKESRLRWEGTNFPEYLLGAWGFSHNISLSYNDSPVRWVKPAHRRHPKDVCWIY